MTQALLRVTPGRPGHEHDFQSEGTGGQSLAAVFMVPGILAFLVTMIVGIMCSLNNVREKEIGTIEQIKVTPIRKLHFNLGNLLPIWLIGTFVFTIGLILARFAYWSDIDIFVRGERLRSTGHGFCGISRRVFLNILQQRCERLGVRLRYETEVGGTDAFRDSDLVLAGDGANSRARGAS